MDDAIVVVSFQVEGVLQPVSEGIFGIGVLSPIHVKAEVNEHHQVAEVAELQSLVGKAEHSEGQEHQRVFEEPIVQVCRPDQRGRP